MRPLTVDIKDNVAVITLNDPDRLNALSADMRSALMDALNSAPDSGARVAVIRGSGRAFCAGYNLTPADRQKTIEAQDINDELGRLDRTADLWLAIRRQPMPVIAQVHGYCLAGGTDLLMSADIAIASKTATIGIPNVRALGVALLMPMWAALMGPMRAKLMAFTGDSITGEVAAQWGMVAAAVPESSLDDTVSALAARMARVPLELLTANKRAIDRMIDIGGLESAIRSSVEIDTIAHATRPYREFWDQVGREGLRPALESRDGPFAGPGLMDLLAEPRP